MNKIYKQEELGYEVRLGEFAKQADGAVWLQQGGTIVLAAVVSEKTEEFPGFFPLSVDHRELFSSVGKIPGGYFKREGKPSDKDVLTGRAIDRCIRPLFPNGYFYKVQVTTTVYSLDKNHASGPLALVAASLALSLSKIPFMGPTGSCELVRVDGKWIVHPNHDQTSKTDVRLTVSGNIDGINMVEGSFAGITEKDLLDGMFIGHEEIKKQIIWQNEIIRDYGHGDKTFDKKFDTTSWEKHAREFLTHDKVKELFFKDKSQFSEKQGELEKEFFAIHKNELDEHKANHSFVAYAFDSVLKEVITELVFLLESRLDGRKFNEVRKVSSEVGLLPFSHGSALFNRGETQLLASTTLGSSEDELKIEKLVEDEEDSPFTLHYNFLPFSVGEARGARAPGRREIGHGYLAANALKAALPSKDEFPYTIRIVADTLGSNGSSSMATVCSGCLSLMDAGVPIKAMIGGIAMGMVQNSNGEFCVLTDLSGAEDAFGLMDFKVAGTTNNITAIQMDIKHKGGLSRSIFENALELARVGRLHILNKMKEVMETPRSKLSNHVPQFVTLKISRDKIGAVIGSGGKIIREITEKTGTSISIEDDGLVKIFGQAGPEGLDRAVAWVKVLAGEIEAGQSFIGTVKKNAEFGYFVELVPGQDGLVHISTVPRADQENFKRRYQEGDKVSVVVLDYDSVTGRIRLKIAE